MVLPPCVEASIQASEEFQRLLNDPMTLQMKVAMILRLNVGRGDVRSVLQLKSFGPGKGTIEPTSKGSITPCHSAIIFSVIGNTTMILAGIGEEVIMVLHHTLLVE
mmetsp:Transcript_94947/g.274575  ORF Transcript_94947/g.274575 Transcript_94947/m.274575 type:complete len:106 (-) Transcript_94947:387-704(-)